MLLWASHPAAPTSVLPYTPSPVCMPAGQDPQVSQMATQYIWTCSPCLILSTVRMCIKSYFSSQVRLGAHVTQALGMFG